MHIAAGASYRKPHCDGRHFVVTVGTSLTSKAKAKRSSATTCPGCARRSLLSGPFRRIFPTLEAGTRCRRTRPGRSTPQRTDFTSLSACVQRRDCGIPFLDWLICSRATPPAPSATSCGVRGCVWLCVVSVRCVRAGFGLKTNSTTCTPPSTTLLRSRTAARLWPTFQCGWARSVVTSD